MSKHPSNDDSFRFLFKDADIRGETVTLDHVLTDLLAAHDYGAGIRRLLGEFAAATVVISNNLKFDGRVVLQGRSEGPVSLIMLECSSDGAQTMLFVIPGAASVLALAGCVVFLCHSGKRPAENAIEGSDGDASASRSDRPAPPRAPSKRE